MKSVYVTVEVIPSGLLVTEAAQLGQTIEDAVLELLEFRFPDKYGAIDQVEA